MINENMSLIPSKVVQFLEEKFRSVGIIKANETFDTMLTRLRDSIPANDTTSIEELFKKHGKKDFLSYIVNDLMSDESISNNSSTNTNVNPNDLAEFGKIIDMLMPKTQNGGDGEGEGEWPWYANALAVIGAALLGLCLYVVHDHDNELQRGQRAATIKTLLEQSGQSGGKRKNRRGKSRSHRKAKRATRRK